MSVCLFSNTEDTQLEVKIVMPWKEEVKLEYHVVGVCSNICVHHI